MKTPEQINSTGKCLYKKPAFSRLAAIYWAAFIPMGLILAIFLSSLLRTDGSTPGFAFIGRIPSELQSGLHVPMFFGLTLIVLVFLKRFEKCERNQLLFAFVLANYVGILNEGLQMLIPGRNASLGDVGLNLAGTLLGLVFYFGIRRWKSVNRGNSDSGGLLIDSIDAAARKPYNCLKWKNLRSCLEIHSVFHSVKKKGLQKSSVNP